MTRMCHNNLQHLLRSINRLYLHLFHSRRHIVFDFAKHLEELGTKNIIFTDISKDGTLSGPNFEMLEKLSSAVTCDITASGGIRSIDDLRVLKEMNLYGAIIGKAIYENRIDLKEVLTYTGDIL